MTTPRALRPRDGRFELFSFGDSRGSRRCAGGPGGRRYDEDNVAFKQSEESSLSGCLLSTSPVSCACLWVIISPADVSVEAVYYMGHQPCCEVCVCVCVESFIWTSQKLYEDGRDSRSSLITHKHEVVVDHISWQHQFQADQRAGTCSYQSPPSVRVSKPILTLRF